MGLTRAQRNSLIEDAGVDQNSFKLKDSPERFGFELAHHRSRSAFDLNAETLDNGYKPAVWFGYKRVGADPMTEWEVAVGDWQGVLQEVRQWIAEITAYEGTPELWEPYRSGLRSSVEETLDNEPLTPEERAEWAAGFDQVLAKLAEMSDRIDLTAADVHEIKETVDYLKEASERLGKKDLKLVVIGQAAMYAGPVAKVFLGLLWHGVGHMLGLPPPPPALPM